MNAYPSIRLRLVVIVLAIVVPAVAALGLLGYILYDNQKRQVEIDMLQTTRALVAAVDRDFSIGLNVGLVLANSKSLQDGDLPRFHALAEAALTEHFPGMNFVLSDESGQQLLNTLRPLGTPLPKHGNPAAHRAVIETGKPGISKLYIGGVSQRPVVSIDIPVIRDGSIVYVLSVGYQMASMTRLLHDQRLPPGRMAAVFDPDGVIAARTHMADKFVGRKGIPELLAKMLTDTEGLVEAHTLEGLDVLIAFSRSPETGWSVGISTPWTVILSEALKKIAMVYIVSLMLLLIGLTGAWVIGGNISRSVRDLMAPALALGRGDPVVALTNGPREILEVSHALKTVEQELRRYRDDLETLVVERTAALEASNRELEQFAYVASHDLQEPLRMVVSYVDLLEMRYGDQLGQDAHEFIGFAREGAHRMSSLIQDLLQFSRLGRHDPVSAPVDLRQATAEALDNLKVVIEECGGEVHVADGLPTVSGNHVELVSLFQNLVNNGLKYRKPDQSPRVDISAERDGADWIIRVADNGIGIEPQYHERIFRLFQRLHSRAEYPGNGIGLALCRKIVERHDGRIWVESEGGKGSAFCFALPAERQASAEP